MLKLGYHRDGRRLTLHKRQHDNDTQPGTLFLPFDDLTYGTCVHVHNDTPIFIGIASDGAVFIARFGNSNITILRVFRGNGSISWNQHPIMFSENRQVFGVYDVANKDFQIANVTAECSFVRHIGISDDFRPDLVAFIARNSSYTCGCQHAPMLTSNIHGSSSIKWPLFGIPVICGAIIILLIGIGGCIAAIIVCVR